MEIPPMIDFRIYAEELAALQSLPDTARLPTKDACKALNLMGAPYTPKTLEKLRYVSTKGPSYMKVGGFVFYELGALRTFAGVHAAEAA